MSHAEQYMTPEHPDAFTDMDVHGSPDMRFTDMPGPWVRCPKCKGHGGWNLLLNQYPSDIPAHRHFRAACMQCNGWGWVKQDSVDATCIHDLKEVPTGRMFDHRYVCTKGCGKDFTVDSSG
jgi:hypothetical protein